MCHKRPIAYTSDGKVKETLVAKKQKQLDYRFKIRLFNSYSSYTTCAM